MKRLLITTALLLSGVAAGQVDCEVTSPRPVTGAQVLGDGTPGSVTTTNLQNALNVGGPISFNMGPNPVQINLTARLRVTKDAVIDGGGLVTLSGQNQRRLFLLDNPDNLEYTFTVQNMTLVDGSTRGDSGAAIYKPSGGPWQAVTLEVINSHFNNNHAIQVAQDGGGGAIYATGLKAVLVSESTFSNNSGSNGGAIYSLGSEAMRITDSVFDGNAATGNGGNPGNGGNGGAIGVDGAERSINVCRSQIINNTGQAFGVGFFTVMYDQASFTGFTEVLFENNTNALDFGLAGGVYLQGGPIRVDRSSFINNRARGAGGLYLGPNTTGELVNSTVYGNVATNTLGGGMFIENSAFVTLRHMTIMNNQAPCGVCFAGGISISSPNFTTMYNSILANNTGGNAFNPWNILSPISGNSNLQFPQQRPNGQAEVPATGGLIWGNPMASAPALLGGLTPTMAIASNGAGIDQALPSESTPNDQRGRPRHMAADLGAYELQADLIFADGF